MKRIDTYSNLAPLYTDEPQRHATYSYALLQTISNQSALFDVTDGMSMLNTNVKECMPRQYGLTHFFQHQTPTVVLSSISAMLPFNLRRYLMECYCVSAMLVIQNEHLYVVSIQSVPDYSQFTLLLYKTTMADIHHMSNDLVLSRYVVTDYKPMVFLDLDKTLYICEADCLANSFQTDYVISGMMAITKSLGFQFRMMIRHGAHRFLQRLSKLATVFCITAGDLHYAREAVAQANACHWVSTTDPSLEGYTIEPVHIPLDHVYSVRNCKESFIRKTFAHVIYTTQAKQDCVPMVAIDDDVSAWNPSDRHHVLSIPPFYPSTNSPIELLTIMDALEAVFTPDYLSQHQQGAALPDYMVQLKKRLS